MASVEPTPRNENVTILPSTSMSCSIPLSLVVVASCAGVGAERTPEDVISAFFGPSGIEDRAAYCTGEMLGQFGDRPTLGQCLPPGVRSSVRPLFVSSARSAFGVTLAKDGTTQDWYAYLVQVDGVWKLEAVRTLALTGIPASILEDLRARSSRTPEEEWMLQNLDLVLASDAELKDFVISNVARLERIVSLVADGEEDAARTAARELFIDSVTVEEDGRIELVIGGMVDNSVGIGYLPDATSPPPITPYDYIYVERVRDRWYLFKTT